MIIDAEQDGRININRPDKVIILEATGGNTGIGIAQTCSIRGYHCILTIPDNYSKVRINLLKYMGAQVILSDHKTGNDSHIRKAHEILEKHPEYFYTDQLSNQSNVKAHYLNTGQEILSQIERKIDFFVAGIGSGGTLTGVGKAIKEKYPECKIIGIQPKGCNTLNGEAKPHIIEGLAIGEIPKILDKMIIDDMIDVSEDDVLEMRCRLCKSVGLYLGYSSLANIIGALYVSSKFGKNKTIVTISPDGGRNYNL